MRWYSSYCFFVALNMENKQFNQNALVKVTWQYKVRHTSCVPFMDYRLVFLKSNPELALVVMGINIKTNKIRVHTPVNETQIIEFPPECLLPFDYAGLVVSESVNIGEINVCLN